MRTESVYVISPVRQVTDNERLRIASYVKHLEAKGYVVFDPKRDALQDDPTGYGIVAAELKFLRDCCDRVDIFWQENPKIPSEGSRVDLGVALALGKRLNLVEVFLGGGTFTNFGLEVIRNPKLVMDIPVPVLINWNIPMENEEHERQRIQLGQALGKFAVNPLTEIKLRVIGNDPPVKSYPKAVMEILRRGI